MGSRIENEFVPYQQALALKELGFDETCFLSYNPNPNWWDNYCTNSEISSLNGGSNIVCSAPLYQQAFRWFREKYNVHSSPKRYDETKWWVEWGTWTSPVFETYEEAELACLNKLIEIVKQ